MSRYDDDDDTGAYSRGGRARGSRRRRIIGWIAVITTVLITGSSLAAYATYLSTVHSIETFSTAGLGSHRPPAYDASENILLVGSETGIRIDHYVGLTFTGFEKVINDIGGVNVCLPRAIHDPKSGLNLSAGRHHVRGFEALAFWRERYVGEGSDLQRIERQQFLMAGLMQEVKTGGLLSDYPRLYGVIRDAAKALTV